MKIINFKGINKTTDSFIKALNTENVNLFDSMINYYGYVSSITNNDHNKIQTDSSGVNNLLNDLIDSKEQIQKFNGQKLNNTKKITLRQLQKFRTINL